ncbi:hypothetical protein H6784_01725 [Candidatus Nomurabacteria bacterium]|nr:hypothetical protein [Candidatus Nomurabacteria bacterium]
MFKFKATRELPKLGAIKTEWDLKKLYYKSEKDPLIEADLQSTEKAYRAFIKKWKGKDFTSDAKVLEKALTEKEVLAGMPESSRPVRYFYFRMVLNTNDSLANQQLALIHRRFQKLQSEMLFFKHALGSVTKQQQTKLLQDPVLEHFRYYLERVFIKASHHLSEDQEKIVNLKSRQSYEMWTEMTEKIIGNREIKWSGKELPINEASNLIETLPSKQKPKLWKLIMAQMEQIAEVAEHEFNAIITDVRTEDELRGYHKPYSATAIRYEDTEKSIENLVEAVSTKGFVLSKKFYKIKAQYHGVDTIDYSQKYDSIRKEIAIDFTQAVEICRDVFYSLKTEYGQIFDRMLTNGQIDVFPKKGKRGGAFMSAEVGLPTQVELNHVSNFKSLETLAHEMGHAIHAERSKQRTTFYEGHSTVTAETASTLFENLVFDVVYKQASVAQKTVLLHDRITRDIATIQRQIAFFNLELDIHNTINKQGAMSKEEFRKMTQKHLKTYLGPAVTVNEADGYSFVSIPHLRYGFYVYTYAFGLLMSTIMATKYKEDNSYIQQIDQFLTAGASDNVANIFKSIGIDTTKADTFTKALKAQEADINTFAKLVKSQLK